MIPSRPPPPGSSRLFILGWEAATHGERRDWCTERGAECEAGYDAYWAEVEQGMM